MTTRSESLPMVVAELIKRMSPKEKMELARRISWEEIEEWKATQETLADSELMANLKLGLEDEKAGRIEKKVEL